MPVDTFRRIVEKAVSDGITIVNLFSWSEPFLLPDLCDYTGIVAESGMLCRLSSHLSFHSIEHLERTLRSVGVLWVSVSGATQATYSVNHEGGDLELVKANLRRIAELKRCGAIETQVVLKHLEFDYNTSDTRELASLADDLGLAFEVFPGWGHPVSGDPDVFTEAFWIDLMEYCRCRQDAVPAGRSDVCRLFDDIALDTDGNVMVCDMVPNYPLFRLGSYLDLSVGEIQLARYQHPLCAHCEWERQPLPEPVKRVLLAAFEEKIGWRAADAQKWCLRDTFGQALGLPVPAEDLTRAAALSAHRAAVLERELRATRGSTSWRVTAPLRRLGDRVASWRAGRPAARRRGGGG